MKCEPSTYPPPSNYISLRLHVQRSNHSPQSIHTEGCGSNEFNRLSPSVCLLSVCLSVCLSLTVNDDAHATSGDYSECRAIHISMQRCHYRHVRRGIVVCIIASYRGRCISAPSLLALLTTSQARDLQNDVAITASDSKQPVNEMMIQQPI